MHIISAMQIYAGDKRATCGLQGTYAIWSSVKPRTCQGCNLVIILSLGVTIGFCDRSGQGGAPRENARTVSGKKRRPRNMTGRNNLKRQARASIYRYAIYERWLFPLTTHLSFKRTW